MSTHYKRYVVINYNMSIIVCSCNFAIKITIIIVRAMLSGTRCWRRNFLTPLKQRTVCKVLNLIHIISDPGLIKPALHHPGTIIIIIMIITSEGVFYIGGRGFVSQIIEPVTFARLYLHCGISHCADI